MRVEVTTPGRRMGMPESEWLDGPEAVAEWSAWLKTIEPIDIAEADLFDEEFLNANVEAVRRQMNETDR